MQLSIYKPAIDTAESFANFMDFYYSLNMVFLASDLLHQGLSPIQISDAVGRAITVAKSSEMNIREHFNPIYSGIDNEIFNDCKLSRLGYGLVLMNADTELSAVAKWQRKVLENFLETTERV